MCGIAGFLDTRIDERKAQQTLRRMATSLQHRGPDGEAIWFNASSGVGFAHRRLAIVDLSPTGNQPMHSHDGRFTLTYNGEIYNHHDLRRNLERLGVTFLGTSDTEVLLEAVSVWGLRHALERCNGMFAFALWDGSERTLHLVRDRLGEKPLYYVHGPHLTLFGSELKALLQHEGFKPEIDRASVAAYLRHGYVPAPRAIYEGVFKVMPGEIVSLQASSKRLVSQKYWETMSVATAGLEDPINDEAAALEEVGALARDAVALRMHADVPLGSFLSGGIDSSTVVALMQAQMTRRVRSFTIGFRESDFDEAPHAAAVAHYLGTDHTEMYVSDQDALDVIPALPSIFDEPFGDSSQIPTLLLAGLTRRNVTVSLSGDGGDEVFGGYSRYRLGTGIGRLTAAVPAVARSLVADALLHYAAGAGDGARILPERARRGPIQNRQEKLQKLAAALRGDPAGVYARLVTHWDGNLVLGVEPAQHVTTPLALDPRLDVPHKMMLLDLRSYLPDDILVKVDRATMAASLESRAVFLDHRLVELAWRLPTRMKIRGGRGKWLLRRLLQQYLPPRLIDRPKAGFAIPLGGWLRGPLREWAEDLLDERRLREQELLDPSPIRAQWREHLSGDRDRQHLLWDVLMLQAWLRSSTSVMSPA